MYITELVLVSSEYSLNTARWTFSINQPINFEKI